MGVGFHGSVESFYHLRDAAAEATLEATLDATAATDHRCRGLACFVAGHLNPERWSQALSQPDAIHCLGRCYAAPAAAPAPAAASDSAATPAANSDPARPRVEIHAPAAVVLENVARGGARDIGAYLVSGGYRALEKALHMEPAEVVEEIAASGLRGRGGAGFPTGAKWRAVAGSRSAARFVIANGDEGDPGAYIDRFIMEDDPHRLIEGLAIAAYATGAAQAYIYVRWEYPAAADALRQALAEAGRGGFLGRNILASGFSLQVDLVSGRGSYVCGEETALINALAGKRPEPMPRPPYPTERGLFGQPTLVNNVETLANVPWIMLNGGKAFRSLGFSRSHGTKAVSLNSLFRRPGLYEIEFGTPLRRIVEDIGGGLITGPLKGLLIGGPLAGVVPPEALDTPFGFEELQAIGADVGHGGIIAFDEHTRARELFRQVAAFAAFESCGKCTPCRLGSRRLVAILDRETEPAADSGEIDDILAALEAASLCGLGTGLARLGHSLIRHYAREFQP